MTQEHKQLLIKDLSARLSYGVVYHRNDGANIKLNEIDVDHFRLNYTDDIEERECKPYLRSMTSMTEEEHKEFWEVVDNYGSDTNAFDGFEVGDDIDWLNKNHFDYRDLIKKGLAIEVTKNNNPYKK